MKVRASVKKICDKCKVIHREGVVRVICTKPETQTEAGISIWHVSQAWICRPRREPKSG